MSNGILTYVSPALYNKILKEKRQLQDAEKKKIKSKRRRITMITASNSISARIK